MRIAFKEKSLTAVRLDYLRLRLIVATKSFTYAHQHSVEGE